MGILVPHLPTDKGSEIRLRSLLEDIVGSFEGPARGVSKLALAVWFNKRSLEGTQHVLALYASFPMDRFGDRIPVSLRWRTGEKGPPFAEFDWTSVDYFLQLLISNRQEIDRYFTAAEVLAFDKTLLDDRILDAFKIVTEPTRLVKGWYVDPVQYAKSKAISNLLASHNHVRPNVGLVKTYDSPDAENCRGLLQVEVNQKWVPLSLSGLKDRTFFNDLQDGRPGYFLFQGGALYQPLKFEEKTAPEYSNLVLERLPDDRYPEVYLRAVHPTAEPAA